MGYFYARQCYETISEARDALMSDCGARFGYSSTGAAPIVSTCTANDVLFPGAGTVSIVSKAGASTNTTQYSPNYPTCTVLNNNPFLWSAEDGFILSAAVVGVWAAAFATRALIRALNAADNSSDIEE